jgi:hypothetical protein
LEVLAPGVGDLVAVFTGIDAASWIARIMRMLLK